MGSVYLRVIFNLLFTSSYMAVASKDIYESEFAHNNLPCNNVVSGKGKTSFYSVIVDFGKSVVFGKAENAAL